ncbi:hypothetical protein ANN_21100 [Periplaneta americana]|uniref:Uncharacterized protein n=1 Tax=Periplaneta americana TaxID=6978 RepID=A0ABQ8SFB6_PERAM|nr:hypothetical protein ANN_21100 [Periplaneta americana]
MSSVHPLQYCLHGLRARRLSSDNNHSASHEEFRRIRVIASQVSVFQNVDNYKNNTNYINSLNINTYYTYIYISDNTNRNNRNAEHTQQNSHRNH